MGDFRQSNLVSMHIGSFSSIPERTTENQFILIIYPVEVKDLWKDEIVQVMPAGSIKVLVYLGANKQKGDTDFSKYDFVIITFSTLTGRLQEQTRYSVNTITMVYFN